MKRAEAKKAIDKAFATGLKELFVVLERNIIGQDLETATAEFECGVAKYDQAHTAALAVIERVFKE